MNQVPEEKVTEPEALWVCGWMECGFLGHGSPSTAPFVEKVAAATLSASP